MEKPPVVVRLMEQMKRMAELAQTFEAAGKMMSKADKVRCMKRAAQRAKAVAVVKTQCSAEAIDLTALAAINALIECSRPHLPGHRFYRPQATW